MAGVADQPQTWPSLVKCRRPPNVEIYVKKNTINIILAYGKEEVREVNRYVEFRHNELHSRRQF